MKGASWLLWLLIIACGPEVQVEIRTAPHTNRVEEEYPYYLENGQTVKHGYYRSFYPDGSPKETGEYAHGLKEGEWVYRQDEIKRVGLFADDRLVGLYKYYDSSDRKIREGT